MGVLVAKRYPTKLVLGLADHTYVECSVTRGWACFGGKTGGTALRSAVGSTKRANAIAEPSERAGIKCYAINGVCHQAANRILWPAKITVRGARGYKLSEAIYGPYGRFRALLGLCDSPFNQHPGISGDLPDCMFNAAASSAETDLENDAPYLDRAAAIYEQYGAFGSVALDDKAMVDLHVELFMLLARREMGRERAQAAEKVAEIRADEERERMKLENAFAGQNLSLDDFVMEANGITDRFQERLAKAMQPEDYSLLLGLMPGERVRLVDPAIAGASYSPGASA